MNGSSTRVKSIMMNRIVNLLFQTRLKDDESPDATHQRKMKPLQFPFTSVFYNNMKKKDELCLYLASFSRSIKQNEFSSCFFLLYLLCLITSPLYTIEELGEKNFHKKKKRERG